MDGFGEKLILQLVSPLASAVVGTLIFGTFVAWIARRAQDRRSDINCARKEYVPRMQGFYFSRWSPPCWLRNQLENIKNRLKALEAKTQDCRILTEAQVTQKFRIDVALIDQVRFLNPAQLLKRYPELY